MEKFSGFSMDITSENIKKIKAIFPDVVVENKIDIDKLLNILGEDMNDDFEKYEFKWKGKIESLQLAGRRSAGTLRPCVKESKNWDDTENIYIEGDNLEVLKLLQQGYHNKVKMIYIDPPYNTGQDFVYKDTFGDSIANYKEITEQGARSNPETAGRYHTNWLNMIYPRLRLAKTLLTDDGVIFISIDEVENANLRKVCDEAFGEDNFIAEFIWHNKRGGGNDAKYVAVEHEYVLLYAKNKSELSEFFVPFTEDYLKRYKEEDDVGKFFWDTFKRKSGKQYYPITCPDGTVLERDELGNPLSWLRSEGRFNEDLKSGEIRIIKVDDKWSVQFKQRLPQGKKPRTIFIEESVWGNQGTTGEGSSELLSLFSKNFFDNPKPLNLVKHIMTFNTSENDIILDFFSGSATTAHAVMQLNAEDGGNRKFIMVQLPEKTDENSEAYKAGYKNICEIGKERIRRAGEKILAEKAEKEKQIAIGEGDDAKPLDIGFKVFKLDTSSIKKWDGTPVEDTSIENLWERLNDMTDTIKPDRTDMDVVYEVLLKFGIDLNIKIIPLEFEDGSKVKKAYSVREDCLMLICLAEDVSIEMVEQMAELAPGNVVFAEDCFKTDTDITNAELVLKDRSINIRVI